MAAPSQPISLNQWYPLSPCLIPDCSKRTDSYEKTDPPIPHFHPNTLYFRVQEREDAMSNADAHIEYLVSAQREKISPAQFVGPSPTGIYRRKVVEVLNGTEEVQGLTRESSLAEVMAKVCQAILPKVQEWKETVIFDPTVHFCDS